LIRSASAADTKAVLRLWAEVVEHASMEDRAEDVHRLLARDGEGLLVAEDEDDITGTLVVGWDGWRGNLYRLAVAAGSRRKGIAAALVAEGERRLVALGCRRVSALVVETEDPAKAFWASAGYTRDPNVNRFVKNIGQAHPAG
jgi:ribosomal protein S18 acetylase RimI-like enzyme